MADTASIVEAIAAEIAAPAVRVEPFDTVFPPHVPRPVVRLPIAAVVVEVARPTTAVPGRVSPVIERRTAPAELRVHATPAVVTGFGPKRAHVLGTLVATTAGRPPKAADTDAEVTTFPVAGAKRPLRPDGVDVRVAPNGVTTSVGRTVVLGHPSRPTTISVIATLLAVVPVPAVPTAALVVRSASLALRRRRPVLRLTKGEAEAKAVAKEIAVQAAGRPLLPKTPVILAGTSAATVDLLPVDPRRSKATRTVVEEAADGRRLVAPFLSPRA